MLLSQLPERPGASFSYLFRETQYSRNPMQAWAFIVPEKKQKLYFDSFINPNTSAVFELTAPSGTIDLGTGLLSFWAALGGRGHRASVIYLFCALWTSERPSFMFYTYPKHSLKPQRRQ